MLSQFSDQAMAIVNDAITYAREHGHRFLGTEHLLLALIKHKDPLLEGVFKRYLISFETVEKQIISIVGQSEPISHIEGYTDKVQMCFEVAFHESRKFKKTKVEGAHLLLAILRDAENVATQVLHHHRLTFEAALEGILRAMNPRVNVIRIQNNAKTEATPLEQEKEDDTDPLERYARDLTQLAQDDRLDPVIGRETEIDRLIQVLARRSKHNPCLIGEPGVGKTAIVEGLAQRIVTGAVPNRLKNKRVMMLDMARVIAGSKYRGEFESRMTAIMKHIKTVGDVILFLDEIHTVMGAGGAEGAIDASSILKPALARGEVQVIGTTTLDHYKKYIERDAGFERRLQPVIVKEPNEAVAIQMLTVLQAKYETHHGVKISQEAIEAAVKLSSRYVVDRFLPDVAVDVMDEAMARASLVVDQELTDDAKELSLMAIKQAKREAVESQNYETAAELRDQERLLSNQFEHKKWVASKDQGDRVVDREDINRVVADMTQIPITKLQQDDIEKLKNLEDLLRQRVIGQDHAIALVAKAIRRARVGLKSPDKPVGTFMFLGPTGVGKTELCKALAEVLFDDEKHLVRLDMSEYMERHAVSKLIGSPPGYVGFEEGGQLTEKIRRSPYSIVLFDEIEKAHPDVFNILLQLLDDGRLTDAKGRLVDFKHTLVIMTSNLGTQEITGKRMMGFVSDSIDARYAQMHSDLTAALKKHFKPEFLNRLDDIVIFNQLTKENLGEIVYLLLADLEKRLKDRYISLRLSKSVLSYLETHGYSDTYGARPMKRLITQVIEDQLSEYILLHPDVKACTLECFGAPQVKIRKIKASKEK